MHKENEKIMHGKVDDLKTKVNSFFDKLEGEVSKKFDIISKEIEKQVPFVEKRMKQFDESAENILEPAKANGTDHIEENLDFQKDAWKQYTEHFMAELERLEEIMTDNTTALRVEQSYLYSLNETAWAIEIKDEFVEVLRSLLVLLGTLIFFIVDMLIIGVLFSLCCAKNILNTRDAYRRIYPKRYVPARGPDAHYYWARRTL